MCSKLLMLKAHRAHSDERNRIDWRQLMFILRNGVM
jgi:hypothetical protein